MRVFFVCFVVLTLIVRHSTPATIWKDVNKATPKPVDDVNEEVLELAHLKTLTSHGGDVAKDLPSLEQQLNALEEEKKPHRGQPEEATGSNDVPNDTTNTEEDEEKGLEYESDIKPLLKNNHGKYSAFDMAQYVFWTGDEAGVARAIEELIHENYISREKAIKLLSDIKMEIEYLQKAYGSRGLTRAPPTAPTTTPGPTSVAPENESKSEFLSRLRAMATSGQYGSILETNAVDYDEAAGRLRLADFLYAEYSLEEIIYQLAKVMFSQSLTKGSEHAHIALQRLTEFLESEGNYGRISPSLQKKVLDVLLAALSDTLADVQNIQHPIHKEQQHK